ncbi:C40 family peptidase [Streptomyces jeddahensis]|uniref:Putative endopeptidase n=1 Tax=Streptomyces jeddahensis TaxID=1716141 RepID=A0A177HSG3_9ACTN|nr:C40 family peptidase [Streptomyces jeddahensis]OAH13114.1 putative endopeptidase precursor [Streptomyces jeddahensis]
MASHRKPRNTGQLIPGLRTSPAVGFTAAALTSVALMSQTATAATAAPKPSLEEVQKKVDDLYRQAGVATQKYNAAKERTDQQRTRVDGLLDDVAERTEKLNEARQELGSFAAAQYRTGSAVSGTATLLLAEDPQEYFDQSQLMNRLTSRQKEAVDDYQTQQIETTKKREEATESLETLTESQADLKASKQDVQQKLSEARELLSKLTAEEKARLAAIERKKEEEARRKAEELARQQAEEERQRQEAQEQAEQEATAGSGTDSGSDSGSAGSSTGSSSYAALAAKVIDFAEAQIGKPYVWGATGPGSYDCSGLTQAAWKAAGVSLPRTTWDQVKVGTTVSVDNAQPGDLVFFYDDISHVGIYIGNGEMIHAPKPGANVRVESIYYMPIHSVVRPV